MMKRQQDRMIKLCVFFAVGIIFGILLVKLFGEQWSKCFIIILSEIVTQLSQTEIGDLSYILSAFHSYCLEIIWLLLFSCTNLFGVYALIFVCKMGLEWGILAALVCKTYGMKGIAFFLSFLFPQDLLRVLLVFLCICYLMGKKQYQGNKIWRGSKGRCCLLLLTLVIVLALIALLSGTVGIWILQYTCKMFRLM